MAFFGRLFAGRGSDALQEGLALFEQGRASEAIPLFRSVFDQDPGSLRGSLAGLHLRQAIVELARDRLHSGQYDAASDVLSEAVGHWPEFPDLQFLAGSAGALAGRWAPALDSARAALRRNPDYCEARLLEVCCLHGLDRPREAHASLLALLESGRRVDHALVRRIHGELDRVSEDAVVDLLEHLRRVVLGDDAKRTMAEALALCRAGEWQEGVARLRRLVGEYPHYPDIRARLAAALYQTGDLDDALLEVEAALRLNANYRTAVSLKGLVLAEHGRIQEAEDFLAGAAAGLETASGRHEELFLAYLRAALALLLGDLAACRKHLEGWHDLPRQFARAVLLLAACDDLSGQPDSALRRMDELHRIWPQDAELLFLQVALLLRRKQFAAAESMLANWPGGIREQNDPRPLLLRSRLNLELGRPPVLPADHGGHPDLIHEAAWRQLAIAGHLLLGEAERAWELVEIQFGAGLADEETGRLCLRAAVLAGRSPRDNMAAVIGPADSWLVDLCRLLRARHEGNQAEDLVGRRRAVRPDLVKWSWLSAGFWLDPVRRWIS